MSDSIMEKVVEPSATNNQQIKQIKAWFEAAVPTPGTQNIHAQIGVHFEEVAEMFDAMKGSVISDSSSEKVVFAADVLHYIQTQFKALSGGVDIDVQCLDREGLLDSLCDQIVTAVGVAHMLGLDIEGALQEVADSNDSKFDDDGKPIFNEYKKIMKGPRYFKPNLSQFVS